MYLLYISYLIATFRHDCYLDPCNTDLARPEHGWYHLSVEQRTGACVFDRWIRGNRAIRSSRIQVCQRTYCASSFVSEAYSRLCLYHAVLFRPCLQRCRD